MKNTSPSFIMTVISRDKNEDNLKEFLALLEGKLTRRFNDEAEIYFSHIDYSDRGKLCLYIDGYVPCIASHSFGYYEMDYICTTLLKESQNLNLDIEVFSVSCLMSEAEHLYLSNGEAYLWRLAKYSGFGLPRNLMDYPYDWEVCDPRDYVWNESENYQEINDGDEVSL